VGAGISNRRGLRATLATYATVTPAAVVAEVGLEDAWFGGFADLLGKLDDRLDQLLPVEQGGVVVVGAGDLDDPRLPGSDCRDRAALFGRHDRVARAVHDRRRHLHARELVGERVAVAQQRPDGQERVVDPVGCTNSVARSNGLICSWIVFVHPTP
jgi:hypothetical protein